MKTDVRKTLNAKRGWRVSKKKRSTRKKPRPVQNRPRLRQTRRAHSTDLVDDGAYWHGGVAGLEVGTILIGADEARTRGIDTTRYHSATTESAPYDPGLVYFSSQREFARGFAANTAVRDRLTGVIYQRGTLYRVEPVGEVLPDPDFPDCGVAWSAPQARIVAVEEENVALHEFSACKRVAPYMSWKDGSPIYDDHGKYLLSPEQRAAGYTQAMLADIPPWTPLNVIKAAAERVSSGLRANAREHVEIARQAAEPIDVLARHRTRATMLLRDGVDFRGGGTCNRAELQELIAPVVLEGNDPRGVCVAVHPRDGLIGACVVTAFRDLGRTVMMIDRVVVTPAWRHRGVGSVLMLTVQQLVGAQIDFAGGRCDSAVAPFFAQLGYTILKEDVPLVLPLYIGNETPQSMQAPDQSMFYRQGPY